MDLNETSIQFTFLLAFVIGVIGFATIAFLLSHLRAGSIEAVKRALTVLVSLALFTMFFTIYTYPGVISPGILLELTSLVMTPVSAIAWILISTRFIRSSAENRQRQRWFWASGLAVVLFLSSPLLGRPSINQVCRVLTRRSGQPLIVAIREYQNDHGSLPEDPGQLVPDYLPSIPAPPCSFLTGYIKNDRYVILGDTLTTNSADGFSCEDFSFDDNLWSVGGFDFIDYGPYCD